MARADRVRLMVDCLLALCKEKVMRMAAKLKQSFMNAPNAAVGWLIKRFGLSPAGAQLLEVRGRRSGELRSVPVNPIEVDGRRYLVAPRGETQWVRNFRAAAEGAMRVGDRTERIAGREIPDAEKPPILGAYLDRWYWQVSRQFEVPKDADLNQLAEIAASHPVFEIENVPARS